MPPPDYRDPHVVHQSDVACLALLKAKSDGGVVETGEAAKVGSACHAAAEALMRVDAETQVTGDSYDPMRVAAESVHRIAIEKDMEPVSVLDALTIMEKRLKDGIGGIIPPNATVYPERTLYLDDEFKPCEEICVACAGGFAESCARCAGTGLNPDRAFESTIDQLIVLEREIIVVDFKTVLEKLAQAQLFDLWQARFYSFMVLQHFPDAVAVTFRWYNLRHGYWINEEFRRGDPWETTTRARMTYERNRRLVAAAEDDWREQIGPSCRWCPLMHKCATMNEAVEQGLRPGLADVAVAERYLGVKELATQLERASKEIVEATGPITLSDGIQVLGQKPWTETVFRESYEKALETLRALGMTEAQEQSFFAFARKCDLVGRVKKAVRELLPGRGVATKYLRTAESPLEPNTTYRHQVWTPPPVEEDETEVQEAAETKLRELLGTQEVPQ